jgi:protein SCO1
MAAYLRHFDNHIIGLTGSEDAISRFSHEIGAGYRPVGSTIDHSSSLFVIDPEGRLAGIILRPNDSSRVSADLAKIRSDVE